MKKLEFPKNFVWGSATASYQVEGAAREDGRGESIWDRYCAVPGNVLNSDTGLVACDHYHRYKEDVALMKHMGLAAYRLSIAWPRVIPDGNGPVNEKGLDFYSDLVDELLAAGITPYVTLYHWDLPQALQDMGGWANPEAPAWFARYAQVVFDRLGGRVKHWMTLNEPFCTAFLGNYEGRHAPGLTDFSTAVRVAYHLYVGHGLAVKCFREGGYGGEIGIALNLMARLPYHDTEEDKAAAHRADGYLNRWFIDPIMKGEYPADMVAWYTEKGVVLPEFKKEHLALMSQPLDFIGLNYYNDFYVKHDPTNWPLEATIENPPNMPVSERGWPVTEIGFAGMLLRLTKEYGVKNILITESGISCNDIVDMAGKVDDTLRKDYYMRHLAAMHSAMQQGAPVCGYLLWSFCDNFEWAFGYTSRFGMVFIDFETQQRIIKESGKWYMDVIRNNGFEVPG